MANKKGSDKTFVGLRLPGNLLREIDDIAEAMHSNRTLIAILLLESGLEALKKKDPMIEARVREVRKRHHHSSQYLKKEAT